VAPFYLLDTRYT